MSEVTVEQLANDIGAPVERLLKQMSEAGLSPRSEKDAVSDEEKKTLLTHLKRSHGETAEDEPKKITLKRKTTSTLKMSAGQGKTKTVNVEVRKKRTYVKRPDATLEIEQRKQEEETKAAALEAEQAKKAEVVQPEKAVEDSVKQEATAKESEKPKADGKKKFEKTEAKPAETEKKKSGRRRKTPLNQKMISLKSILNLRAIIAQIVKKKKYLVL